MSTVRIGNASGYYGDRLSAVREQLEGGDLDYLTGDYLAELTMLILGRDFMKDQSLGYAKTFVKQMADTMALAKEKGVKIVSNAGGLNPASLATKLREVATEQGIDIHIAHIEGDDLRERADELGFNGAMTANAYLGAFGIAEALNAGADIVVTGRVTDAAVVAGPAIAHFGWGRNDYDALAGSVVAGHIIECGTQATGGNFSGFVEIDFTKPLGFPIAEIAADGSCVITKHEGTGGAVTIDTVTAQLVYEIQGSDYLGPDVVTHFDTIQIEQDGPDRVSISGVRGSAPPETLKVCLNFFGGFRNDAELLLTGLDIDEKAGVFRQQVEAALEAKGVKPDVLEWRLDRTDVADPATQAAGTTILRIHAEAQSPDPVGRPFSDIIIQLALASYPGFTATRPPAPGNPFGFYKPGFIPQSLVPHTVVLGDGTRIEIPPPTETVAVDGGRVSAATPMGAPPARAASGGYRDQGETTQIAFGRLAHARSGDKGGDANIGVWIPANHPHRDDATAWLLGFLTPERVKELLPETASLEVEVIALPNLGGVNVLVRDILGKGVAASSRLDPQAKALGEWLRARIVDIPSELLEASQA